MNETVTRFLLMLALFAFITLVAQFALSVPVLPVAVGLTLVLSPLLDAERGRALAGGGPAG